MFLLLFNLFINSFNIEIFKYGIVDYKRNNYYQVESIFYKTALYTDNELKPGDIIYLDNNISKDNKKYNIKFSYNSYEYISSFKLRNIIFNQTKMLDEDSKQIVYKTIYGFTYDYDKQDQFLTGLLIYYFINSLIKDKKILGICILLLYSLLFCFQIKFILIIFNLLISKINLNRKDKLSLLILILFFYNNELLSNYSFLIPVFFRLINIFNLKYKSYLYYALLQTYLFGSISLLNTILFKYIIKFKIVILLISFILIIFPEFSFYFIQIYKFISNLYNFINIEIRGILSVIGIILFLIVYKIDNNKTILMYISLILILLLPINYPFNKVTYIDVSQGDAILIKERFNKTNILIDTGSPYNYIKLKKYLYSEGIYKLDYLIISHNDLDHNGNIDNLYRNFKINELVEIGKDIDLERIKLIYYDLGKHDNDNDNSLVYELLIDNYNFLFTGDISKDVERKFCYKYLGNNNHYDFLKVSHHGSYTGTDPYFISQILPKYAIISTSGQYNHPHYQTINTLNSYLVDIYNTNIEGNIEVYLSSVLDFIKTNKRFVIIG